MAVPLRRLVLGSVAAAALAFGIAALTAGQQETRAQSNDFIIAIQDDGFNPQVCKINRGAQPRQTVKWTNKDDVSHRVVFKRLNTLGEPVFDTGVLQPGQTSVGFSHVGLTKFEYYLADDPSKTGLLDIGDHAAICRELPPTPTPTNTPTITPTRPTNTPTATFTASPTFTPSPTVTPDPRRAILPMLAKDEDR